jgi:8-oxo-dGTP pyrophosphatase MutT (NUDIX family)
MRSEKIYQVLQSRTPKTLSADRFTQAAVLVPIQEQAQGDCLIFTKRAEGLSHHSGQVAFPGGRVDPEDMGNLAAALRETHEEIGIDPNHVRVLGQLDQVRAAYGYVVTPFVGVIPSPCEFRLNQEETAAVFSVPIVALLEPGCFTMEGYFDTSRRHPIYHFYYDGWDIWGATARIVKQFLELVYDFKADENGR